MKEIALYGKRGGIILVDDEDYERVNACRWYQQKDGYATHGSWNPELKKVKTITLARFILNPPLHMKVDHINFNKLDNRKENLRLATIAESTRHRRKFNKFTGYKGVKKIGHKWQAKITFNDQPIYFGMYSSPESAALAYDLAALEYHKEFAEVNFTEEQRKELMPGFEADKASIKRINKPTTSKYLGVSYDNTRKKWMAYKMIEDRKFKNLGRFNTEIEAVQCYNKYAKANGLPINQLLAEDA